MNELPPVSAQDVEDGWRLRSLAIGHLPSLAFHAACHHDLFSRLEAGARTPAQLAEETNLDSEALALLLEALTALQLLQVRENVYANTPISSRMLVRGKPMCQLDIVAHNQVTAVSLERAEKALLHGHLGAPPVPPGHLDDMMAAMGDSALLTVNRVLAQITLSEGERLLDLGGGAGSYCIGFGQARPDLTAVLVELPEVAEAVRPILSRAGLSSRVEVRPGDMRSLDLGGDFSVVLLSNVLHYLGHGDLEPLLARIAAALRTGGRVLIHDSLRGGQGEGPLFPTLLALRLLTTSPGRGHTLTQVVKALEEAGLSIEKVHDMAPEPGSLIVARKA